MSDLTFRIVDGEVRFVHSDDAVALVTEALGDDRPVIARASHVEPYPFGAGWVADMAPSDGPVLFTDGTCHQNEMGLAGLTPFPTRAAALAAEREWLREHRGL